MTLVYRVRTLFWTKKIQVIYQTWDAVFHHQMKHREESWKYDAQRSIFDELRGVSSGDETLCRMFDISSQTKSFLKEKLRMQKWAVFHLISKHSLNINFLWIFFMNLILMSLRRTFQGLSRAHFPLLKDSIQCEKQPWVYVFFTSSTTWVILSWMSFCVCSFLFGVLLS